MVARTVDLRSDTVTKPTETMRAAMATAEVDDDVLGADPTAFRLESEVAKITGKEAGLFVSSGTMGNLISVLVHCDIRGSEVILGDNSHIHIYENGGISTIGGVHPRPVKNNEDGTMDIDSIEVAIRDPRGELVFPTTKLICLENSHANSGGRCLSAEYTDRVGELAKKNGLKLHIDGARIFNASVALGVPVQRLVQAADSVSVCLSKGLGAPVGSVIVGSKSFITKARRLRKTLGGGMRQVGFICAAAFVALKENVEKLDGDHKKAKELAVLYGFRGPNSNQRSKSGCCCSGNQYCEYGIVTKPTLMPIFSFCANRVRVCMVGVAIRFFSKDNMYKTCCFRVHQEKEKERRKT
ncbi:probable low-specificity L-threonine aldolase 2 isoform X2 [Gossypium arboreum]|uniref:probable low-specificity L-threonine aldolase 2 isoform X2 n=1 Tax=Gossypium arboreum TaxID=29729 RepID=UPI0022F197EF|nr:probable low-specificity L-threonine aldolase 2 isoform X2 [Gossypium arboreum]